MKTLLSLSKGSTYFDVTHYPTWEENLFSIGTNGGRLKGECFSLTLHLFKISVNFTVFDMDKFCLITKFLPNPDYIIPCDDGDMLYLVNLDEIWGQINKPGTDHSRHFGGYNDNLLN